MGIVHVGGGEGRVFLGPCSPVLDTPLSLKSTKTSHEKQPLARGCRESGCLCMKSDGPFYFPCPVVVWGSPAGTSALFRVAQRVLSVGPDCTSRPFWFGGFYI